MIGYQEGTYSYIDKATEPYIRSDTPARRSTTVTTPGPGTFPPLDPAVSFPYTPIYRTVEDETVKVPAWLNDRRYYHNRGDTTFAGESSEYGDFFGLDDLFTEHPDVVDGMTDIYEAWVDFGIDGFRIDTVKHVNVEFWQTFAAGIAAQAEAAGNDDFFAFGEVFDANPAFMSRYTTEAGLQATIDFGFQARAQGLRRGPSDGGTARPVRRRRLLHRHRLERVLVADVPRQPRHGSDRKVHRRSAARSGDELLRARPARALADVPHPRPAGRVLRRRAGLRRRRRRQGRPAGHVPVAGRARTTTTT